MNISATNKTDNSSATDAVRRGSEDCILALGTLSPFTILAVITNGMVFALFFSRRKLRTPSNLLLLSLAVSDFLNGALNCPLFMVYFCLNQRIVALFLAPLHNFSATSCALHILAITAEKYVAIMKPLRHHAITKKTVSCIVAGIWLASSAIAFIPFTWYKYKGNKSLPLIKVTYAGFCLLVVFLVPCTCMMYGYVVMFKTINQRNGGNQLLNTSDRRNSRVYRKVQNDRKCLMIFASMAAIFVVCWLPYYVLMLVSEILTSMHTPPAYDQLPPEVVYQVFVFMRYLSSISNPLLYTFFKRDFWKAFKQLTLNKWRSVSVRISISATLRRGSDVMFSAFRGKSNVLSENETSTHSLGAELLTSETTIETQYVSAV